MNIKEVRAVRIANGIKQFEFAELMGIPIGTWSNIELGNQPFYSHIRAKASAILHELNCDFSIMDDEEGMNAIIKSRQVKRKAPKVEEQAMETIGEIELPVIEEEHTPEPTQNAKLIDMVNRPPHYANRQIEVIDVMRDTMTHERFIGFLEGQVIRYLMRWDKKWNPEEDLEKAEWYLKELIKTVKGE